MAEVFVLNLGCYLRVLFLDLPLFSLLASQLFENFLAPRGAWPRLALEGLRQCTWGYKLVTLMYVATSVWNPLIMWHHMVPTNQRDPNIAMHVQW
jgi:hypothetical protein